MLAGTFQDFYSSKKDRYDISKLPDIYDCIVYDALHNQRTLQLEHLPALFNATKPLADYVVPQEYGITEAEKRRVAVRICRNLATKILRDIAMVTGRGADSDAAEQLYRCEEGAASLQVGSGEGRSAVQEDADGLTHVRRCGGSAAFCGARRHRLDTRYTEQGKIPMPGHSVRTRLYFTSESHLHSMLNLLRYGCVDQPPIVLETDRVGEMPELNYLSAIVLQVYERTSAGDKSEAGEDPSRFRVALSLAPGVDVDPFAPADPASPSAPVQWIQLNQNLGLADFERYLNYALANGPKARIPRPRGGGRRGG